MRCQNSSSLASFGFLGGGSGSSTEMRSEPFERSPVVESGRRASFRPWSLPCEVFHRDHSHPFKRGSSSRYARHVSYDLCTCNSGSWEFPLRRLFHESANCSARVARSPEPAVCRRFQLGACALPTRAESRKLRIGVGFSLLRSHSGPDLRRCTDASAAMHATIAGAAPGSGTS